MPQLKIVLLGAPQILVNDQPVPVPRRKVMALLVYLVLTRQSHRRDKLATLLWPESKQQTARSALRRELATLKELLGDEYMQITREEIGLAPRAECWVDIEEFRQHISTYMGHQHPLEAECETCLEKLTQAAELYQDDFLAGFTLNDCPEFNEWHFFTADGLQNEFAGILATLVQMHEVRNQYERAIDYARRWLSLDTLHESVHRTLMRLYAQSGQQAAALRQYEESTRSLRDDLGIAPTEETVRLYQAIRSRRFPNKITEEVKSLPNTTTTSRHPTPSPPPPETRINLPTQSTVFVGRTEELTAIRQLLVGDDDCRLLTLIGPGGIGKTRLAIEAASDLLARFPDGICFVELASVETVGNIVYTVADSLGFPLQAAGTPETQLANYLKSKKLLLVVDNLEHLLDGAKLLANLLRAAPAVKMLLTSREALGLPEEWLYPVGGMNLPEQSAPDSELEANQAVQLFLQCARRADASFRAADGALRSVAKICRLVDGMPLGVELAAAWIGTISLQEIIVEIQTSIDFLSTSKRNIPERHRSLRAVIEQTWQRLSETEQAALCRLSVFRGGCQRVAAQEIADTTLATLSLLIEKALLRRNKDGRLEIHELVRQFVDEKRSETAATADAIEMRHAHFYTSFLQLHTEALKGIQWKIAVAEIGADINNVRAAWQWAVKNKDTVALGQAAEGFWCFIQLQTAYEEGKLIFRQAVDALTEISSSEPAVEPIGLAGYILCLLSYVHTSSGDWRTGQELAQRGLKWLRQAEPQDKQREAFGLLCLGHALGAEGDREESIQVSLKSNDLYTQIEDYWGVARSFRIAGQAAYTMGKLAKTKDLFQRGLVVAKEHCFWETEVEILFLLSTVQLLLGDYTQPRQLISEAFTIVSKFGNEPFDNVYLLILSARLAIAEGDYAAAMDFVVQSRTIFEELGLGDRLDSTFELIGTVWHHQGEYEAAEKIFREKLALAQANSDVKFVAIFSHCLGCVALTQENYGMAEQYMQDSLAIWLQHQNEFQVASVRRNLGYLSATLGGAKVPDACNHYNHALEISVRQQLAPIALDVFMGVAHLLAQSGKQRRATELLAYTLDHPSSTFETKEKCRQLQFTLDAKHSEEEVIPASVRHQLAGWQTTAQVLQQELLSPEQFITKS